MGQTAIAARTSSIGKLFILPLEFALKNIYLSVGLRRLYTIKQILWASRRSINCRKMEDIVSEPSLVDLALFWFMGLCWILLKGWWLILKENLTFYHTFQNGLLVYGCRGFNTFFTKMYDCFPVITYHQTITEARWWPLWIHCKSSSTSLDNLAYTLSFCSLKLS